MFYLLLSNNFVKGAPTSLLCVRHNHVTQIIKHVTPYTYWYDVGSSSQTVNQHLLDIATDMSC